MKHEYRKHEKEIYNPKAKPQIIKIDKQKYICIKGVGNPNNVDFALRIGSLYPIAYAIKMSIKKEGKFNDYTVYPLEGLWDISDNAKKQASFTKDDFEYTIMLRQPEFVSNDMFNRALENVKLKKPNPLFDEVYFCEIEDGLSIQMLHVGSYDTEQATFDIMIDYLNNNNYEIKTKVHREIYLSDFRKVSQEKLKTILRYQIKEK